MPLVRDWIVTVLNPLIDQVARELEATGRSWTWYYWLSHEQEPGDFESLQPVVKLVGWKYRPNYEQVCAYDPGVGRAGEAYDAALARLRDACSAAYRLLVADSAFDELVRASVAPDQLAANPTIPWHLAGYVVNGPQRLPGDQGLRDVWNPRAADFLAIAGSNTRAGEALRAVRECGGVFIERARDLDRRCTDLRNRLADRFGIARVPASSEIDPRDLDF